MTSSPTKVILSRAFVQAHRSQARLISSLPLIILERWSSPAVNFRCWGSCSESCSGDSRSLEKESGPGSAGLQPLPWGSTVINPVTVYMYLNFGCADRLPSAFKWCFLHCGECWAFSSCISKSKLNVPGTAVWHWDQSVWDGFILNYALLCLQSRVAAETPGNGPLFVQILKLCPGLAPRECKCRKSGC